MFLIVGLGNPGDKYKKTRHNVGFMAVDAISEKFGFEEIFDKPKYQISIKNIQGCKIAVMKPMTYMNLSGVAVYSFVSMYKIPVENVLVIHDDIELPPMKVKIKLGGSAKGHNGLRNIDSCIGNSYWRIRIGVGRPENKSDVNNFVISNFSNDEIQTLQLIFDHIADNILEFIENPAKNMDKLLPNISVN